MNLRKTAILALLCCSFSICSLAQKNELSVSVGALHSSDQKADITGIAGLFCPIGISCNQISSSTSTGIAFEGTYARQLFNFKVGSLDLELPLLGAPGRDLNISALGLSLPGNISTTALFFTPSARIKLFRSSPVSPFVSVGGGFAHFGTHFSLPSVAFAGTQIPGTAISISDSKTNGALQFGGGLDFKTPIPILAVRAEVRDFWALGVIQPGLVRVSPERQHNIFAGAGLVLRF